MSCCSFVAKLISFTRSVLTLKTLISSCFLAMERSTSRSICTSFGFRDSFSRFTFDRENESASTTNRSFCCSLVATVKEPCPLPARRLAQTGARYKVTELGPSSIEPIMLTSCFSAKANSCEDADFTLVSAWPCSDEIIRMDSEGVIIFS